MRGGTSVCDAIMTTDDAPRCYCAVRTSKNCSGRTLAPVFVLGVVSDVGVVCSKTRLSHKLLEMQSR